MTSEPMQSTYALWVDLYDLANCDELLSRAVAVKASIGWYESKFSRPHLNNKSQTFTWKKTINLEFENEIVLPTDIAQVPDIFINIYTVDSSGLF